VSVEGRRRSYGILIASAIALFVFSLMDVFWLDEALFVPVMSIFVAAFIVGLVLLVDFTPKPKAKAGVPPRSGVLSSEDLYCKHCKHVFRFGMERAPHGDGAFSCPNCGVRSRFPSAGSSKIALDVPHDTAWTTQYQCTNCSERILLGTYGRSHHREVLFRPCPTCSAQHSMRIVASSGSHAEPVEAPVEKQALVKDEVAAPAAKASAAQS